MAGSDRSEKPSPRKLKKARDEGSYVVSKEFAAAAQFLVFFGLTVYAGADLLLDCRLYLQRWVRVAFAHPDLQRAGLIDVFSQLVIPWVTPLLVAGVLLTCAVLAAQLGVSGLGVSLSKLQPDLTRLNPLSRLKQLPRQNLTSCLQAAALLPIFLVALWLLVQEHLPLLFGLSHYSAGNAALAFGRVLHDLLWRSALVFVVVGIVDWIRQQSRYTKQLKMTKQEVKDEHKETEGNPQIKGKLRKMQRDMSRRQMISNVPKASAVIVNPTHYSVAIRYELGGGAAPRVIAKGKNYLARRIRESATAHEIPIVENPPLARALYSAADVGQEIPPHLYRAVAEILAYLYRILGGRLPGNAAA